MIQAGVFPGLQSGLFTRQPSSRIQDHYIRGGLFVYPQHPSWGQLDPDTATLPAKDNAVARSQMKWCEYQTTRDNAAGLRARTTSRGSSFNVLNLTLKSLLVWHPKGTSERSAGR